ncbi:MAG: exonuclease domain-containing protein [Flavobacteriales bacterium]|nr:exonuclease domain-containing protein [Flavobacteriales bacterium]
MYAVIDLESTGGRFSEEGITEIAIYKYDGHEVVDRLVSLVNPLRPIDPYVTKLTGIDNKMLRRAPRFYELAKRIVEITEGCAIVAHNAEFDYRMLRQEFARLGYIFERNTICTVKESQRLIPGQESYSLGKLCKALGIPLSSRHRAYGDAEATLLLLQILIEKDSTKQIVKTAEAPTHILSRQEIKHRLILDTLPTFAGIFQILDKDKNILYIGRTSNIYKEMNHILCAENDDTSRIIQDEISSVTWEETSSDAISYLKYINQLTTNRPILNLDIRSRRMTKGLRQFFPLDKNMVIVDKGRNVSEKAVILVEKGVIRGYTYCGLNYQIDNLDVLKARLTPIPNTPDNLFAVRSYVKKNVHVQIIYS